MTEIFISYSQKDREFVGMIAFYSTDLGKKTIRVLPALVSESIAIGQRWGRSLAPAIDEQVKARWTKRGLFVVSSKPRIDRSAQRA